MKNSFPIRLGFLLNILQKVLNTTIKEEKIKDIKIRKEELKLSLFIHYIIVYVENPKESTKINKKTFLEQISEFNKVAVHKINIQKSIVFLYTSN